MRPGIRHAAAFVALVVTIATSCSDGGNSGVTASTTASSRTSAPSTASVANTGFQVHSSSYDNGEDIPLRHACAMQGGKNESPPLEWSGVPDGTTLLVVVLFDPDAPGAGFPHWVLPVDPSKTSLETGADPKYFGPCPPGKTPHHYELTLYAFDDSAHVPAQPTYRDITGLADRSLGTAKLSGLFAHQP